MSAKSSATFSDELCFVDQLWIYSAASPLEGN